MQADFVEDKKEFSVAVKPQNSLATFLSTQKQASARSDQQNSKPSHSPQSNGASLQSEEDLVADSPPSETENKKWGFAARLEAKQKA